MKFRQELKNKLELLKVGTQKLEITSGHQVSVDSLEEEQVEVVPAKVKNKMSGLEMLSNELFEQVNNIVISDDMSRPYYNLKKENIRALSKKIKDEDMNIILELGDPSKYGYDAEKIKYVIRMAQEMEMTLEMELDRIRAQEHIQIHATRPEINSRLPSINLPKFDGTYSKWPQFSDLFIEMVEKSSTESTTAKMQYLNDCLQGDAKATIQHLNKIGENYHKAWEILKAKYDNKRVLVNSTIDRLLEIPSLNGSSKSVKIMCDTVKECITSLERAGHKIHGSWDPILVQILTKKLDRETRCNYEESIQNPMEVQTLEHFIKFIEKRCQVLEVLGTKQPIARHVKQSTSSLSNPKSVFMGNNTMIKCLICGGPHLIYTC
jgi:hypothetical protein